MLSLRPFAAVVAAVLTPVVLLAAPAAPALAAPAGSIHGTVTDAAGTPLPGTRVGIYGNAASEVTTAADGSFTITASGGSHTVCAQGASAHGGASTTGYLDGCVYDQLVTDGQTTQAGQVKLPTAGALSGRVTDSHGAPLAGVVASVTLQDYSPGPHAEPVTAADGTFRVTGLVAGSYTVCFDAAAATGGSAAHGYQDECWDDVPTPYSGISLDSLTQVPVTLGHLSAGIDAQLGEAGGLQGVVRDAGGHPLAGVQVWAGQYGATPGPSMHTTTGADGSYHLSTLRPGDFTLCFDGSAGTGGDSTTGYLNECYDDVQAQSLGWYLVPWSGESTVTVLAGQSTTVKPTVLDGAGRLTGTVTSSAGAPIAGVRVYGWGQGGQTLTATDVTDAAGHYTLSVDNDGGSANGMAIGTRLPIIGYRLFFSPAPGSGYVPEYAHNVYSPGGLGFGGAPATVLTVAGTPTVTDESLASAGSISGTARDAVSSTPLSGVHVALLNDGYTVLNTDTADDGSYTLGGLPAGDYTVCFSPDGTTSADSPAGYFSGCYDHQANYAGTTVHLGDAESRQSVDGRLDRASKIVGTVTDTSGHKLSNIRMSITSSTGVETLVYTNYYGTYSTYQLVAGTYTVCAKEASTSPTHPDECYLDVLGGGTPTPVVVAAGQVKTVDLQMDGGDPPPDTTPPTAGWTGAAAPFQTTTKATLTFTGSDAESAVSGYDIRFRWATWNSTAFTAYAEPANWQQLTATSLTFTGLPGRTYCMGVRAHDAAGNVSAWTADRCTTLPLDDRGLTVHGTWTRPTSPSASTGTLSKTVVSGSTMVLPSSRTKRVALLVVTCASCGKVAVYLNGVYWRTVNTYSPTTHYKVLIPLPTFSYRSTSITLKAVLTAKQQLLMDGLGVSPV